jgi:chromosome partitioning protein
MLTVIGNLKGGTGKSTVVFNLGLWLRKKSAQVLLVDLDPQATLSDVIQVRREEGYLPELDLVADLEEARLRLHAYDEVLFDVGTSALEVMYAAIAAADRVIIPVPPSQADVWSTQRFVRRIRAEQASTAAPRCLAFINRADTHQAVRESDEAFVALESIAGLHCLPQRLGQRMAFRRSFSEGLSVEELEARSKAASELDALAEVLYPAWHTPGPTGQSPELTTSPQDTR